MWHDSVITNAGRDLLAQWAGGGTLQISKATAGSGTVPAVTLAQSTALVAEKQLLTITQRKPIEGGMELKLQITAADEADVYTQIGIWGRLNGGDEVLLAIYQDDTGIGVPSKAEMPGFVFAMYCVLCISNALDIDVTVDTSAYVTHQEMLDALAGLKIDIEVDQEVIAGSENPVSGGAVARYVANGAVQRSGDTMQGALIADEIATAGLTVAQMRNVASLDVDPGEGTVSSYPVGTIVLVRETGGA